MGVRAETLGAALRRHRRAAGLSQDQLAQRSGVSVRTIRNIEGGRVRAPRRTSTEALADALRLVGGGRELFVACGQPVVDPGRDDPVRVPLTPAARLDAARDRWVAAEGADTWADRVAAASRQSVVAVVATLTS